MQIWPADGTVTLTLCRREDSADNKPAVIVLPGGGYIAPAPREGEPVAEYFAQMGYLGCVLNYSTLHPDFNDYSDELNPHTVFPEPMHELAAAISLLRGRAEELGVDPDRIALIGFSAGGHLAANYCNYWDSAPEMGQYAGSREEIRPNACVLCYPAVYLNAAKGGTMVHAAFGEEKCSQEELDRYNAQYHISKSTPPTFIWHTADDTVISARQAYDMAVALSEQGVPHELHVFSTGPHAAALSPDLPAHCWPELADEFLKRHM